MKPHVLPVGGYYNQNYLAVVSHLQKTLADVRETRHSLERSADVVVVDSVASRQLFADFSID